MPEIYRGLRHFESTQYPEKIVMAFHSSFKEVNGGIGGNGLSTIAKYFAQCLMGEGSLILRTGEELRNHFKNQVLPKSEEYTDHQFNLWRENLGINNKNTLLKIDKQLDRQIVKKTNLLTNKYPVTIVDSKLFSWLQFLRENKVYPKYPGLKKTTLISIGVGASEDVSIKRTIRREKENNLDITYQQAQLQRINRLDTDLYNTNKILYPQGELAGYPYNATTLNLISHYQIDNSSDTPISEMESFIFATINQIANDVPTLAPTLLKVLCSNKITTA